MTRRMLTGFLTVLAVLSIMPSVTAQCLVEDKYCASDNWDPCPTAPNPGKLSQDLVDETIPINGVSVYIRIRYRYSVPMTWNSGSNFPMVVYLPGSGETSHNSADTNVDVCGQGILDLSAYGGMPLILDDGDPDASMGQPAALLDSCVMVALALHYNSTDNEAIKCAYIMDSLARKFKCDPNRIYYVGTDQGAHTAFVMACALPNIPAAMALIDANGTGTNCQGINGNCAYNWPIDLTQACAISTIPTWVLNQVGNSTASDVQDQATPARGQALVDSINACHHNTIATYTSMIDAQSAASSSRGSYDSLFHQDGFYDQLFKHKKTGTSTISRLQSASYFANMKSDMNGEMLVSLQGKIVSRTLAGTASVQHLLPHGVYLVIDKSGIAEKRLVQ